MRKINLTEICQQLQSELIIRAGSEDLEGYCAISAIILQARLAQAGFYSCICFSEGHAVNLVSCAGHVFIIDLTANQFDSDLRDTYFYRYPAKDFLFQKCKYMCLSIEAALSHMKNMGWPREQIPVELDYIF